MTTCSRLAVDGAGEVEVLDHDTRSQVEVVLDELDEVGVAVLGGSVSLDKETDGTSDTDGVSRLDEDTACEARGNDGLGNVSVDVGSGSVDLGEVLSREGTTTVGTPTSVGVDDDLSSGQTGVTLGSTNDEAARGLDVVDGLVVKEVGWDDLLDDLLEDLLSQLLGRDGVSVLGGYDDGVDANGDHGTTVLLVLDGDLGLGVGSQPAQGAVPAGLRHGGVELVGEDQSQRHELRGLVGSVTEHDTLVTSTMVLDVTVVKTLSNVGRLLLNSDEDVAGLVVESLLGVIVTDVLDGVSDDLLVVELSLGGDLTEDHDHTGLGGGLTGDLGVRVLLETGIEDGIGDLVADLVWVTLTDGLAEKMNSGKARSVCCIEVGVDSEGTCAWEKKANEADRYING